MQLRVNTREECEDRIQDIGEYAMALIQVGNDEQFSDVLTLRDYFTRTQILLMLRRWSTATAVDHDLSSEEEIALVIQGALRVMPYTPPADSTTTNREGVPPKDDPSLWGVSSSQKESLDTITAMAVHGDNLSAFVEKTGMTNIEPVFDLLDAQIHYIMEYHGFTMQEVEQYVAENRSAFMFGDTDISNVMQSEICARLTGTRGKSEIDIDTTLESLGDMIHEEEES
ncbi:MAG: hypothetical protein PHH09_01430 [Methanoregulaceae archaeon]|nr:hypothetical protein [Methanoregulaceae archaeon]